MSKQYIAVLLLVIFAVVAVSCSGSELPPLQGEIEDLALDFISLLVEGDYSGSAEYFNARMKRAMPPRTLAQAWEDILAQTGPYEGEVGINTLEVDGYDVVIVTSRFQSELLDIRVVFDSDSRITGLWFNPPSMTDDSAYIVPPYADPDLFSEVDVTVGSGEWALPGTLTIPEGSSPFPAVILVHGSGPQDRDESVGPNKPLKDLAWGLASQGIAVLRYEKRTKEHGQRMDPATVTVWEETMEDAITAVELLRARDEIDAEQIYILGHSLGGTLAPRIGAAYPELAGLIILAGAARPLEDLVLEQSRYLAGLDGTLTVEEETALAEVEAQVARVKDPGLSSATPPEDLPLGIPAPYWLDLRGYNPAQTARELTIPLLILQGERDYQVTMEDFALWQNTLASRSNVTLQSYPSLNHLFMAGEGRSAPEEYFEPGNVSEAVVSDIAAWITR